MASTWYEKVEGGKDYDIRYLEEMPDGFARTGYEFLGWSITPGPNNTVDYGGIYSPVTVNFNQSTTLYAVWTPIHCTITFEVCGGQFDITFGNEPFTAANGYSVTRRNGVITQVRKQIIKGREIGEIPYVSRNDGTVADPKPFILVGWFDNSLGGSPISRFSRIKEDTTVYAQWYADSSATEWTPEYCTVGFNGSADTATVIKGKPYANLPAAASGKGWFEKSNPNSFDKQYTNETPICRDVTLYQVTLTDVINPLEPSSSS